MALFELLHELTRNVVHLLLALGALAAIFQTEHHERAAQRTADLSFARHAGTEGRSRLSTRNDPRKQQRSIGRN